MIDFMSEISYIIHYSRSQHNTDRSVHRSVSMPNGTYNRHICTHQRPGTVYCDEFPDLYNLGVEHVSLVRLPIALACGTAWAHEGFGEHEPVEHDGTHAQHVAHAGPPARA